MLMNELHFSEFDWSGLGLQAHYALLSVHWRGPTRVGWLLQMRPGDADSDELGLSLSCTCTDR